MFKSIKSRSLLLVVSLAALCRAAELSDVDLKDDPELLQRIDVQRELELTGDQLEAIDRSDDRVIALVLELIRERPNLTPEEVSARALDLQRQKHADQLQARQEVLLPFQMERLEELRWQYRSVSNPVNALTLAFELSDEQQRQLREKESDLRAKLLVKLQDFQDRAEQEMLGLLTSEQRAQWKAKCGREFKFKTQTPGLQILGRLR